MEPDSVSDWVNVGVNVLIAGATLIAVWSSVATAKRARADQESEAASRRKAEKDLLEEQRADAAERARAALELQALREESERETRRVLREAEVTRMAERQAVFVRGRGQWVDPEAGISGDLHALIDWEVINTSDAPITEVSFRFERTFGKTGNPAQETPYDRAEFTFPVDEVGPGSTLASDAKMTYVWGHLVGDDLGVRVRFTDKYLDDWEVSPDGSMHLRMPPKITADDAA